MTRDQLFSLIQKAGLIPVPVSREGDADEVLNYFEGELAGFLVAAQAIGSTTVFVMEEPLREEHFFYSFEDAPASGEDAAEYAEIDLTAVLPTLEEYRKHLGDTYSFFLMARGGADNLCLFHYAEWVEDFEDEVEQAEGLAVLTRQRRKKNS